MPAFGLAPGPASSVRPDPAGPVQVTFLLEAAPEDAPDDPAAPPPRDGDARRVADTDAASLSSLKRLSIEELMNLEVSSVSKQPERQREAAAAVFVITAEDIRRSGVRTLPDALRLAPGMHVARIDANKWAVGVRGFASRFARSVLVLVDGRSVYTPLFAGTYWEVQDLLLEDIDRIEVIRGPGGTLWGANAFNGVINIITRSARDTHGDLLQLAGGTEERARLAYRHGGETEGGVHWRAWAKGFDRDAGWREDGIEYDDWRMARAGFRFDWDDGESTDADPDASGPGGVDHDEHARHADSWFVTGDAYAGRAGQRSDVVTFNPPGVMPLEDDADLSGAHVLARWTRSLGGGGETSLQAWLDWTDRDEPLFREKRATFDVDFQHRTKPLGESDRHRLIWGANLRVTRDDAETPFDFLGLDPSSRTVGLGAAFVQDEVTLGEEGRTRLIFGTKLEKSGFSDLEVQPNVRVIWQPQSRREHVLWAAVSRAVRTPSRVEEDLSLTQAPDPVTGVFTRLIGPGDFDSETVTAFEAGWRVRPWRGAFLDFAAFYHDFEDLLGLVPGTPFVELDPVPPHVVVPLTFENHLHGRAVGVEVAAAVDLGDRWRVHLVYSYLDLDLEVDSGPSDGAILAAEGQAPKHQVVVRSHVDLPRHWTFDVVMRWVDELRSDAIDDYWTADVRLGWAPRPGFEVAIVGHDLVESHHREFVGPQILSSFGGSEVERGVYGTVTWRW